MTAQQLQHEAYQARALRSIATIEDAEDYSNIMRLWVDDMVKKRMPEAVQTAILEALEAKRVAVTKLSGAI